MRFFIEPLEIRPNKTMIKKARSFASKVVGTVNYKDSNQSNMSKIEKDHFLGKIGEQVVVAALKKFTKDIIGPSFEIFHGKNKSWDADLQINGIEVAVKTQKSSSAKRYGISWCFQFSERRKDPVLNNSNSWVCFVVCDEINEYRCKVFPFFQIKELTFEEPKLPYLKGKKKFVYARSLPKLNGK